MMLNSRKLSTKVMPRVPRSMTGTGRRSAGPCGSACDSACRWAKTKRDAPGGAGLDLGEDGVAELAEGRAGHAQQAVADDQGDRDGEHRRGAGFRRERIDGAGIDQRDQDVGDFGGDEAGDGGDDAEAEAGLVRRPEPGEEVAQGLPVAAFGGLGGGQRGGLSGAAATGDRAEWGWGERGPGGGVAEIIAGVVTASSMAARPLVSKSLSHVPAS